MKKFLLLIFVFCFSVGYAQTTLLVEDFNYTAGDQLTAHNWVQSGTTATNPLTVTTPGLTFTGYPSIAGNACTLATSGQDVYQAFTPVNSGSIYLSFLLNVQSAGTGDYFIALSPSTSQTGYIARVHLKSSGSGFLIGISKSSELTGGASYGTTVFSFNTTYLVVVKHTFVAGDMNDAERVFVVSSAIPSSEPSTSEVGSYVETTKSDPADLGMVTIRQGSTSAGVSPALKLDGIRVATSWSTLLPGATLTAPVAATATNITATGFTANWSVSSAATNYFLDVSTTSDFSTLLSDYNNKNVGNVTTVDLTSLNANAQYYYRVRATDGTTTTSNSNTISVMTLLTSPVAISASDITTTGFTANWNRSTDATSYKIDVSTSSDFSALLTDYNNKDAGSDTTAIVSALTPGTTYYYRVRGSSINNVSGNSNSIMVSTENLAIPLAPVAKEVTNITTTSFTANWNSSSGAAYYSIDVATDEAFTNILNGYNDKNVGLVTMLNVTSLTPSSNYYYRIRASNSGGTSPNSNTISVITSLAAPVAIAATNITKDGFTANWNAETNVTNYWLDVSTDSTFSSFIANYNNKDAGNATSMTVTSLTPNTNYYYRVSASNDFGSSPYSNTIKVITSITGVNENLSDLPSKFELLQNYPNPFNPSTVIKYEVPQISFVNVSVYDILGNKISTLVNQEKSAGRYELKFDASNLPSGIYFYTIQTGSFTQTKKMMLMK